MTDVSPDTASRFRAPTPSSQNHPDVLIRWPELQPLLGGISRVTWWRLIRDGKAPRAIQVSPNCVAWSASEIAAFQAQRAAARLPRVLAAA